MDPNNQLADMRKDAGIQDSPFLDDRPSVGSDPSPREIYNSNNLNPVAEPYTSTAVKVFLVIIGIIALVGVITGSVALSEDNSRGTATTRNTVNIDEDGGESTGVSITTKPSGEYVINLDYGSTSSGAYIRFLNQVVPGATEANKAIVLDSSKDISGLGDVTANRFLGEVGRHTGIGVSDGYFSTLISGDVASNTITAGSCSAIIGGYSNEINTDNSVILGGYGNTIPTGSESGVLLGINNQVNGNESCIIAGDGNTVNASNSVNLAGERNTIATGANHSAIAGGVSNQVYDKMSFVAGGFNNSVSGVSSAIIGGQGNGVSGDKSVVLGGANNLIETNDSVIIGSDGCSIRQNGGQGGQRNIILSGQGSSITGGYDSFIAGNNNVLTGDGTTGGQGGFDNIIIGTGNTVSNYNQCIVAGHGMSIVDISKYSDPFAFGTFNDENITLRNNARIAFIQGKGENVNNRATGVTIDVNGNIMLRPGTSIFYRDDSSQIITLKAFTIQHPTEEDKWLRHGCLEGPEGGVYYRGKDEAPTTIQLPDYATKIASNFTLQITPIGEPRLMSASEVSEEGSFQVFGNGKFHWTATGERVSINPEPFKKDITIHSMGPYSWSV